MFKKTRYWFIGYAYKKGNQMGFSSGVQISKVLDLRRFKDDLVVQGQYDFITPISISEMRKCDFLASFSDKVGG